MTTAPRRPLADESGRPRRLARGVDGSADRRRRDAAAPGGRMDAQPGPADRGVVPDEAAPDRLARRRRPLHAVAGRRRRRQQLRQLAMGGRHRERHEAEPIVQPDAPGPSLRSRRRRRPPLHPGAVGARRPGCAPTVAPRPRREPRGSTTRLRSSIPSRSSAALGARLRDRDRGECRGSRPLGPGMSTFGPGVDLSA